MGPLRADLPECRIMGCTSDPQYPPLVQKIMQNTLGCAVPLELSGCTSSCGGNCNTSCKKKCDSDGTFEWNPAMQKAIEGYSFDQVRYRLSSEKVIKAEYVEPAIEELRKFFMVLPNARGPVGMLSPIVDEAWHAFILHTMDYMNFCTDTFGHYLHHQPNTPDSPADPSSGKNFVDGYRSLFGELHPIWTVHLSKS